LGNLQKYRYKFEIRISPDNDILGQAKYETIHSTELRTSIKI
jgi:hypothetical protein